jgi:ribonucleoside-diphosphate reductase alpha chain
MDVYAIALSAGLQYGVPLLDLVRQGTGLYFVPNGRTDDPEIPRVRSVADYVGRRLAIDWLPYEVRAAEGIFTVAEQVTAASDWLATQTAHIPAVQAQVSSDDPASDAEDVMRAFLADLATGIGTRSLPLL